ncbi:glutathione peroxidase [Peptostreptococcus porci]|uniref:glutathione peroxidase n=1 Tax=Peptostreptococcus porci TaxID=2652282 RepID=UPI0023F19BB1|nr:glutathione peroxidase [Peptostreptococcus porci]MDD7183584.1 glutathione peroxidase [Peptostreptococcus porci]MDY5963466.1 glutathione peroxidase [Peptostreptococcus porci]
MSVYDFKAISLEDGEISLSNYKGKVLLIVNIATGCGLTPQLEGLEKLYKKYNSEGLEIVGFPCGQFLDQNPEDGKGTAKFCMVNYGVTFENFEKVEVNGPNADPLFKYLKEQKPVDKTNDASAGLLEKLASIGQVFEGSEIKWNFTKFLVDRDGNVVERFSPTYTAEELDADVKALL